MCVSQRKTHAFWRGRRWRPANTLPHKHTYTASTNWTVDRRDALFMESLCVVRFEYDDLRDAFLMVHLKCCNSVWVSMWCGIYFWFVAISEHISVIMPHSHGEKDTVHTALRKTVSIGSRMRFQAPMWPLISIISLLRPFRCWPKFLRCTLQWDTRLGKCIVCVCAYRFFHLDSNDFESVSKKPDGG